MGEETHNGRSEREIWPNQREKSRDEGLFLVVIIFWLANHSETSLAAMP